MPRPDHQRTISDPTTSFLPGFFRASCPKHARPVSLRPSCCDTANSRYRVHGTVGPGRTSVSAIAERAGVQRHTVYRHFPQESLLLRACVTHFLTQQPRPTRASGWLYLNYGVRLRRGLGEL